MSDSNKNLYGQLYGLPDQSDPSYHAELQKLIVSSVYGNLHDYDGYDKDVAHAAAKDFCEGLDTQKLENIRENGLPDNEKKHLLGLAEQHKSEQVIIDEVKMQLEADLQTMIGANCITVSITLAVQEITSGWDFKKFEDVRENGLSDEETGQIFASAEKFTQEKKSRGLEHPSI